MNGAFTVSQCATLACLLEATAPKPGNVHRGADFEDLTFTDFVVSAAIVGPILAEAERKGVGATLLDAVLATRDHVGTNTNLGILLLLAPLAAVPRSVPLRDGIAPVLDRLTSDDGRSIYHAINVASSRSLGRVDQFDLSGTPPANILDAMRLAADRDLIARQYVERFTTILDRVVPWIVGGRERGWSLTDTIIHSHVRLLAEEPDSLIQRKCGLAVAAEASRLARALLELGEPTSDRFRQSLSEFDFWLRCDGNRRNPGTTADLLAAGLFVALRDELISGPFR